jgi:hypothetical protein
MMDAQEVEVCRVQEAAFDHFELHAPFWVDSVEWLKAVGGGQWQLLGTDTGAPFANLARGGLGAMPQSIIRAIPSSAVRSSTPAIGS